MSSKNGWFVNSNLTWPRRGIGATIEARFFDALKTGFRFLTERLIFAILPVMFDVTQILNQIVAGDPRAADQLLPLVYDELRKLAATRLANEKPGQTLQATALVHEA